MKAGITGMWEKSNAGEMKRLDMCLEEYVLYLKKKGIKIKGRFLLPKRYHFVIIGGKEFLAQLK